MQNFCRIISVVALLLSLSVSAFANRPVALVYNGAGACKEDCAKSAAEIATRAGFEVHYISHATWDESLIRKAKIWIQPGGVASLVADSLTHAQKARLRRFIADGGGYVGFCAGGFLAANSFYNQDSELVEMFELIRMDAEVYDADTEKDAGILNINWNGYIRNLYFEGGPHFLRPVPAGIVPLGFYQSGEIATVRGHYGRGRVFVTGLHPEAPASWRKYYGLDDLDGSDEDLARDMMMWSARSN